MPRMRLLWLAALAATTTVVLGTMVWKLDVQTVQNWDEAIHGQVSREMVEDGEWVDLRYRGGAYFRKPPLSFWLRSATMVALGDTLWSLRLWSSIAGVLTTLLLGWWAWQRWRNRWLALLTVLVFVSGEFVLVHVFRTGETDGLLTLLVTLALYGGWRARAESHWLLLTGLATGLAVMTKSVAGLLPIPILLLEAVGAWSWPYRWRHVLLAALAFLAVAAPWHVAQHARHGAAFWNDYVGFHVLERATTAIHNPDAGPLFYVRSFARQLFPFSMFFPFAFLALASGLRRTRRSGDALFLSWFVVVLAFFTLTATKFTWYLAPLYPAAALILAPWLATLVRRPSWPTVLAHAASLGAVLSLLPGVTHPASVIRWLAPLTLLTDRAPTTPYIAGSAVVVTIFLVLLSRSRPRWLSPTTGAYTLGKLLVLGAGLNLLTIRALEPTPPLPTVAAAIRSAAPRVIYSVGIDLLHYPAAHYTLEGIPDATVIDLERSPAPDAFTAGDVLVLRAPAELPPGDWTRIGESEDFLVLQLSTVQ